MEEGGSSRQSRREERRDAAGVSTLLDQTAAPRPSAGRVVLAVLRRVASPPIYGIAIGVTIGLVPPLRSLLVEPHAPLAFVRQAISLLGDASIPLNTMLLGASLSHGPTWSAVPKRVVAGVVLTKLALLPLAALLVAFILTRALTNIPPLLLLVILMESATPTANNLMMMTELAGGKASQMMATVFDGITRHNPEGLWFRRYAQAEGFKAAVQWRDSGRPIPEGDEARAAIRDLDNRARG